MGLGGRTLTSHGYVLVRVRKDHHLADVRGYAYEHRIVAERKLKRWLRPGEIVHHINHIKSDNRDSNLDVHPSRWHHNAEHRRLLTPRQAPQEKNVRVACVCGCGAQIWKFNKQHIVVRFVSGHNSRGHARVCFPRRRQGHYNRVKTHCPHGHAYTPDNLRRSKTNRRVCKTCHRLRETRRREERKSNGVKSKSVRA